MTPCHDRGVVHGHTPRGAPTGATLITTVGAISEGTKDDDKVVVVNR
jgi:hypothetical protein